MEKRGPLEELIAEWRAYILRRQTLRPADVEELEDHLRTQVEALRDAGLDEGEAFLDMGLFGSDPVAAVEQAKLRLNEE